MHIEQFRDYCLSFKEVTEEFPFDENTLVFKVAGKMFALADVDEFVSINLKCDPEWAIQLREEYPDIKPGYHMNKKHWNTVEMQGGLDDEFIYKLILHSFERVVAGMPKKDRERLQSKQV